MQWKLKATGSSPVRLSEISGPGVTVPGHEEAAEMFKDLLDVQVWLPADWWRDRVTRGNQNHQPVGVDVHTEFDGVFVQWKSQTVTQDLHRPHHLGTRAIHYL